MVVLRPSAIAALVGFALVCPKLTLSLPTDARIARLFARQTAAEIGSDAWKAQYPPGGTVPAAKQEWLDALASAVNQGLIPSIPVATQGYDGSPSYSDGVAPDDPSRCHYSVGCVDATDYVDAPDGFIGISQDDGPLPPGRALNAFFEAESISATHFYIGANVLENFDVALQAVGIPGQTLAVHSWSHGYSSGQTNEELVGEIGWTMQILADINDGRVPAFWRPPYGDVDNRVRAVAREVFGLRTDWAIGEGETLESVQIRLQGFVDGEKSPGLIVLEHELSDDAVKVFKSVYPSMVSQGWNLTDIPGLWGFPEYKNALTGDSEVDDAISITNTSAVVLSDSADASALSDVAASSSSASASTPTSSSALPVSTDAADTQGSTAEQQSSSGQSSAASRTSQISPLVLSLGFALGLLVLH